MINEKEEEEKKARREFRSRYYSFVGTVELLLGIFIIPMGYIIRNSIALMAGLALVGSGTFFLILSYTHRT